MSSTNRVELSNAALNRIDDACQQFEASSRDGEPPKLENFLHGLSDSDRTPIFVELFHLELEYRGKRGESLELQTYLERFPEYGGVVQEVFAQRMSGSTSRIGDINSFSAGKLPELNGYSMERQLGRGGMGIVFLARSQKLGRHVAIKMIAHADGSQQVATRFQIEAEAIAKVQHANIVQIFEVGENAGRLFLVLEYLPGGSLKEQLKDRPPSPREAARLIEKLARAMHHAHSHGIIHRDLKPSNVLFGSDGEPKVTDFGLAKLSQSSVDATTTGQILGSVQYMAPEQASASQVSAVADVYALGAILYEMLTHQAPFAGGSPLEILHRLTSADVVRPRKLQADVPPDLEAVCLKCLEKDSARRYGSAESLADDLNRYLLGEPVKARPVDGFVRSAKWVRRHPAVSGLLIALVIVAFAGFGLVTWKWRDAIQQKNLADSRFESEKIARAAETAALADAEKSAAAEKRALAAAIRERDLGWLNLHTAQLARADAEMRANYVGQARTHLANSPVPSRGWEHRYLTAECDRRLAAWNEKVILDVVAAGELVASLHGGADRRVIIWDSRSGQPKRTIPISSDSYTSMAFEPKNQLLAVSGSIDGKGAAMVYDAATGKRVSFVRDLPSPVTGVAFSSDGRRLACAGCSPARDGVAVVDLSNGQVVKWLAGYVTIARAATFLPDGDRMLVVYDGGGIKLWDINGGKEIARFADSKGSQLMAASADGKWVASAGADNHIRIIDIASRREIATLRGHRQRVTVLAYDSTANRLASADFEGNVKIWDTTLWNEVVNLSSMPASPRSLAFFAGGTHLAAVDPTRLKIDIWNLNGAPEIRGQVPAQRGLIARRDDLLVYASGGHGVGVRDLSNGIEAVLVNAIPNPKSAAAYAKGVSGDVVALSADGKKLVWGGDQSIKVFDLSTQKELLELAANHVECVAFHPDGNRIISAEESGAKVWDLTRKEVIHTIPRSWPCVAVSPDGTVLATGTSSFNLEKRAFVGSVELWDVSTGKLRQALPDHVCGVNHLAFRPDGKELAAAGTDNTIRVWTIENGDFRTAMQGHASGILRVAYSPDGKRLVSGGNDKMLRIWDVETGRELLALSGHAEPILAIAFHPKRDVLFSADATGVIRRWDAEPTVGAAKP